ncbi:hypothetical protein J7K91_00145, partial [bacterium]|nr:hypothetical protein [bacterium]
GVWETVMPASLISKAKGLKKEIEILRKEKNLDFLFFGIVDIIKKKTFFLLSEKEKEILKEAFSGKIEDDFLIAQKIVSRKKQMVPKFLEILS